MDQKGELVGKEGDFFGIEASGEKDGLWSLSEKDWRNRRGHKGVAAACDEREI